MPLLRPPYFLGLAIAFPVGAIVLFILVAIMQEHAHPSSAGGNVGNYDLSGLGYLIMIAIAIVMLGLISCIASLCRRERGQLLCVICLCLYLLPVFWAGSNILQFQMHRAAYLRYEAAHSHPSP